MTPGSWETVKLGDLFEITSSKRVFKKDWRTEGVPFYRAREIVKLAQFGQVQNDLFIDEEMYSEYCEKYGAPKPDDIMVTGVGTLGITYVVKKGDRFYFKDGNIVWFKSKGLCDSKYVEYALKSPDVQEHIQDSQGATVGTFTIIKAKNTEIPLPPLSEQRRIVSVLDAAFAGLATATAHTQKNLQNARELFESYLNSVFSDAGVDWVETTLGDSGKTQTGSTPKSSDKGNYGGNLPFIKPGDFYADGTLCYSNESLSISGAKTARLVPPGSTLMVCIGATIGKCGFADSEIATNQQINAWLPYQNHSYKFMYYQMLSTDFQRRVIDASGQATLPIINKGKWTNLSVKFPSTYTEEVEIVATLDSLLQETQNLASVYERKLAALSELKESLLHRAFRGEFSSEPNGAALTS